MHRHQYTTLTRALVSFDIFFHPTLPCPKTAFPTGEYPTFESELARLLALDDETVRYEFAAAFVFANVGGVEPPTDREHWYSLARANADALNVSELASLVLESPRALIERFCATLEAYWDAAFASEWQRIEPEIAASVEHAGRELASAGIYSFLESLAPAIRIDRSSELLTFDRRHEHHIEIGATEQLVLTPSYYLWPHVRVNCEIPWPYAIAYPTPFIRQRARVDVPSVELVRLMRSIAHEMRLEIVRLVAEKPRTTQELAPLLKISDSAISKHLRQLTEAGVLSSRRDGYYVLYRLDEQRLEALAPALWTFVRGRESQ